MVVIDEGKAMARTKALIELMRMQSVELETSFGGLSVAEKQNLVAAQLLREGADVIDGLNRKTGANASTKRMRSHADYCDEKGLGGSAHELREGADSIDRLTSRVAELEAKLNRNDRATYKREELCPDCGPDRQAHDMRTYCICLPVAKVKPYRFEQDIGMCEMMISPEDGTSPISHYESALAAHNAGKKVRRKSWPEGMVLETATRAKHKHGELYDANLTKISNCSMVDIAIADFSAADWEIIDD
jgi:hypothetical protein